MDKMSLGAEILRKLGYIEEGVDKFLEGVTMYSEEPYGLLFDLTDRMRGTVDRLIEKGFVVYAAVSGKYIMSGEDSMCAVTYLCLQ